MRPTPAMIANGLAIGGPMAIMNARQCCSPTRALRRFRVLARSASTTTKGTD